MNSRLIKKRTASNLLLFTCVIVLMLIIRFNPVEQPETKQQLSTLKKSDIRKININTPKHKNISLILKNHWQLTSPIQIKANQARIENILNLPETKSFSRFSQEGISLNEFALQPPLATLTLNDTEFLFGDTDPIDNQRYILTNKTLYLVDDIVFPIITANIGGLIDTKLIAHTETIIRYQLNNLSIEKNSKGLWQVHSTKHVKTDQTAIDAWLDRWHQAHAVYVNAQKLPTENLSRISIESDDRTIHFTVFNESGTTGLYREDLELMYYLSQDILQQLITAP